MDLMDKQKVSEIELKIKALQDKKRKLEEKQYLQLAQMIKNVGAAALPSDVLVGALLDATIAFKEKQDIVKKWQQAGKEFLTSGKEKNGKKKENKKKDKENSVNKNEEG